jgi:CTP synthase (UTP-ammonia lyase)
MDTIFVGLVGDQDHAVPAHKAIPRALGLVGLSMGRSVSAVWVSTEAVERDPDGSLWDLDAIWVVPGSPYRSMEGALTAVRRAREGGIPFLGTCGGFQHAVIEYARNVCGIDHAEHAESSPDAARLVISPLRCALVEQKGAIRLAEGSRMRHLYGAAEVEETYRCSYGLNPEYRAVLEASGLRFTGFDAAGDPRAFELADHPFFMGTLFQPERAALRTQVPPLVRAFVQTAIDARLVATLAEAVSDAA